MSFETGGRGVGILLGLGGTASMRYHERYFLERITEVLSLQVEI